MFLGVSEAGDSDDVVWHFVVVLMNGGVIVSLLESFQKAILVSANQRLALILVVFDIPQSGDEKLLVF